MNQRFIKSLSNSNFTPILVLWGYHGDLTKSPWCKTPEGDCSAFNYAPTFNELFVRDLWDGTSSATNWLPDGNVLKWKSYVTLRMLMNWWERRLETNTVTKGICAESLWRKGCCWESWGQRSRLRGGNIICGVVWGTSQTGFSSHRFYVTHTVCWQQRGCQVLGNSWSD